MDFMQADKILNKYNLAQKANEEFKTKTRNDTGKMNVGLRLRICAEHMERKARELKNKREQNLKSNQEKCPNFKLEKKKNSATHDECWFNSVVTRNFCYNCEFYIKNIKDLDDSINELYEAAKIFRGEADYDDAMQ